MARPASQHPTDLELEILKVLWRLGPVPVRQVREALAQLPGRDLAYTSVMTVMNIMVDKGYLRRAKDREEGPGFIYHPLIQEQQTTGRMLQDLVDRAFDGSAAAAMLNLMETAGLDEGELKRLGEMVRRKSAENREGGEKRKEAGKRKEQKP